MNNDIYTQLVNSAHDDTEFWAWVEFEDGDPVVKDWTRGSKPQKPPWEHP